MKTNKRGGGKNQDNNKNQNIYQNNPVETQNTQKLEKSKKQKYLSNKESKNSGATKLLLFPGEEYEFNEKLIHYDAFGFANGNLVSKRCGILLCDESGKALEDPNEEVFKSLGKYYSPKVDDPVIGIIVQKSSEFYKVDIGTYTYAILNANEFEGATKKQKPNLNMGDLIFSRVLKVNKFDAPLLSCISPHEHKNWASGESFFGNLKGGNLFDFPKINTWDFYRENFALNRLNDVVNYEIIIGFNGKMWINSDSAENIFNVYEILMNSLNQTKEQIEKTIHEVFLNKMKEN